MLSKGKTLKKAQTLKKEAQLIDDYTLYKYSDIKNEWIICEGHLNYRYDQIKLFNISQFAIYYIVLAKIPIEDNKQTMAIYLYRNQKQKPSNFFQLNEYDRVSDKCSKPIKSRYYLFELVGKGSSDIELFGANDAIERDKWIKHIGEALQWTAQNMNSTDRSTVHPDARRSWKEKKNPDQNEQIDAEVRSNYEPFTENRRSSLPVQNSTFILPHRPVPPIPGEKRFNSNENRQTDLQRRFNHDIVSTTDNIYLAAKEIPRDLIKEEDEEEEDFSDMNQLKITEDKNEPSTILEDKAFIWEDIFYRNDPDDHARVLNNICQIGAFLVRPQLKQTNSNDHDYTLSIYAFGGIIKYKILKLSNGRYSLVSNTNQPSFVSIPDLCQYYSTDPLPRSTVRDDLIKGPVGNLCLKWPYTYYLSDSNKF